MLLIFLSWLSLNNFSLSPLLENASELSMHFQELCTDSLPAESAYHEAFAALLCGKNITDIRLQEPLLKTSLIHLFVISGSHLILLEQILLFLRLPFFVRFLFLGFYSLVCGWQPPIVRAWFALGAGQVRRSQPVILPTDLMAFFVGLFTLFFFPAWISSRSFQMSWLAALALSAVPKKKNRPPWQNLFWQSAAIYIWMAPALWGFGCLHPLALVFNILLAPLVGFLLFPLGLLSWVCPSMVSVFDFCCRCFFWLCQQGTEPVSLAKSTAIEVSALWIFIFASHFILHFSRVQRCRRRENL